MFPSKHESVKIIWDGVNEVLCLVFKIIAKYEIVLKHQ